MVSATSIQRIVVDTKAPNSSVQINTGLFPIMQCFIFANDSLIHSLFSCGTKHGLSSHASRPLTDATII